MSEGNANMSTGKTNILGFLALFAILAAIWVMFGEGDGRDPAGRQGERAFPGLADQVNMVDTIRLSGDGEVMTLVQTESGWVLPEKGDYPAEQDRVHAFLRSLVLAERVEPRTGDPVLLPRIGLGEKGVSVHLQSAGDIVASFQLGKAKRAGARQQVYMMIEGEEVSWLVSGPGKVQLTVPAWANNRLLPMGGAEIASVTLNDGVVLSRTNAGAALIASDGSLLEDWATESLVGSLSGLSFRDVRRMSNPLTEPVASLVIDGFDGTGTSLLFYRDDAGLWVQGTANWSAEKVISGAASSADPAAAANLVNHQLSNWMYLVAGQDMPAYLSPVDAFRQKNGGQ